MSDNPVHVAERTEWGGAVSAMTEMDRAVTEYEVRRAIGLCGGPEDADD